MLFRSRPRGRSRLQCHHLHCPGIPPWAPTQFSPPLLLPPLLPCGAVVGAKTAWHRGIYSSPSTAARVIEELPSAQPTFRSLTPDHFAQHLACIRGVEQGLRYFLVDLKRLMVFPIPATNEVGHEFGWSANDRYLTFAEVSPFRHPEATMSGEFQNTISIFDCRIGRAHV